MGGMAWGEVGGRNKTQLSPNEVRQKAAFHDAFPSDPQTSPESQRQHPSRFIAHRRPSSMRRQRCVLASLQLVAW